MPEIPSQAFIPIGAIFAALIAGFFSFFNLIISKEQKVSEFRQAWIDSLREEISDLVAAVFHIEYHMRSHNNDKSAGTPAAFRELAEALRETHETYCKSATSILLRINPVETNPEHARLNAEFLCALKRLREAFNEGNYTKACSLSNELREQAAPILKTEWTRVKKGERIFRYSQYAAAIILSIGVLGTVALIVKYHNSNKPLVQAHSQVEGANKALKSQPMAAGTPKSGTP